MANYAAYAIHHRIEQGERLLKKRADGGLVYFLRCGEFVKIGFTINLPERFTTLSSATPMEPELLLSVIGSPKTEKYFHILFAAHRSYREWFRIEGEVLEYMRRVGVAI